jgi:sarcosine oxidase
VAYFEDPRYVPLLQRSLELWQELSASASEGALLHLCGGLMLGSPSSAVIEGTLRSVREHSLPHKLLTAADIREWYGSVFTPSDDIVGVFEESAGYLVPELCLLAFIRTATASGATLRFGEAVTGWSSRTASGLYEVATEAGQTYLAKKIVLAAGAWTPRLLQASPSIPPLLHVVRRVQYWLAAPTRPEDAAALSNIPIYIWDVGDAGSANFYGFPAASSSGGGVKVALHQMADPDAHRCDPDSVDRAVSPAEVLQMKELLRGRMPTLQDADVIDTMTCVYTMTPDEHFLLDFHPAHGSDVVVVSCCSGHGFKFCTVIGEIVADLVATGHSRHDISLFSFARHSGTLGS